MKTIVAVSIMLLALSCTAVPPVPEGEAARPAAPEAPAPSVSTPAESAASPAEPAVDAGASILRVRASPMDPRVRSLPAALQKRVFVDPAGSIEPLVASLVSGTRDPFEKAKLVHDWIADNIAYDAEGFLSGRPGDNTWTGVLQSRKSVCAGYAELFDRMAGAAGLTVRRISGIAKGYGFDRDGTVDREPNHDWNALRVGGRWYLLDVTWDSGFLAETGTFKKEYRTDYLFLEPRSFIYTHFPVDAADQLLPTPVTFTEYAAMPWLRGEFFRYGLSLLTPRIGYIVRADSVLSVELSCPPGTVLDGSVTDDAGARIPCSSFVTRGAESVQVSFSVPKPGRYRCDIFARGRTDPFSSSTWVCAFKTRFSQGAGSDAPYPLLYTSYYEADGQLLGPLDGVLKRGSRQDFRLSAPGADTVVLFDGKRMIPFQKGPDGVFSLGARVPDLKELTIFSGRPDGKYQGLVRYLVR
jgi:hypothetical protein